MMCADSAALYEQVRRRYDERGEATDGIHYLIFHSMEELRASPDLLEGARAMVGRVLAGQDWWVEGGRSRCEALYRAHAPTRPTHFIVAIRDREAGDGVSGDTVRNGDEGGQGPRGQGPRGQDGSEEPPGAGEGGGEPGPSGANGEGAGGGAARGQRDEGEGSSRGGREEGQPQGETEGGGTPRAVSVAAHAAALDAQGCRAGAVPCGARAACGPVSRASARLVRDGRTS